MSLQSRRWCEEGFDGVGEWKECGFGDGTVWKSWRKMETAWLVVKVEVLNTRAENEEHGP